MTENKTELLPDVIYAIGDNGSPLSLSWSTHEGKTTTKYIRADLVETCATVTPSDKAAALELVEKLLDECFENHDSCNVGEYPISIHDAKTDIEISELKTIRAALQQPDDNHYHYLDEEILESIGDEQDKIRLRDSKNAMKWFKDIRKRQVIPVYLLEFVALSTIKKALSEYGAPSGNWVHKDRLQTDDSELVKALEEIFQAEKIQGGQNAGKYHELCQRMKEIAANAINKHKAKVQ